VLTHLLASTLTNQHASTLLPSDSTACLNLQALRNEDDYQKFAGDSNRSHVTVSVPRLPALAQLCWTQQVCHCAVLLWGSAVLQLAVVVMIMGLVFEGPHALGAAVLDTASVPLCCVAVGICSTSVGCDCYDNGAAGLVFEGPHALGTAVGAVGWQQLCCIYSLFCHQGLSMLYCERAQQMNRSVYSPQILACSCYIVLYVRSMSPYHQGAS
jgi:hypothetical protein